MSSGNSLPGKRLFDPRALQSVEIISHRGKRAKRGCFSGLKIILILGSDLIPGKGKKQCRNEPHFWGKKIINSHMKNN